MDKQPDLNTVRLKASRMVYLLGFRDHRGVEGINSHIEIIELLKSIDAADFEEFCTFVINNKQLKNSDREELQLIFGSFSKSHQ